MGEGRGRRIEREIRWLEILLGFEGCEHAQRGFSASQSDYVSPLRIMDEDRGGRVT